jgi:hypothetical protein
MDTHHAEEQVEAQDDTNIHPSHSLGGPFIHALCGKGFATASKVEKHHWGKKHNDLATTTGCWSKHKKPDVAWDDHPSCKDGRSKSETTESMPLTSKQIEPKNTISELRASATLDTSQYNTIPGFRTLNDLPRTVAKVVRTAATTIMPTLEKAETLYHTHRTPPQSSLDSLLTAVNVTSRIDAPKLQDCNDSIILQLDTQAVAADISAQHSPFLAYAHLTNSINP